MTKISATVVADSKAPTGERLTTMLVTFPRFILAELNTHRMLSKNSASSRAIPFDKMLKSVGEDPFIPIAWQKDHKGMQGSDYEIHVEHINLNNIEWLEARDSAIEHAKILSTKGNVTKQLCNRLLEPFMWHTVLISGTEWENFFQLRCPQYSLFSENIPLSFRSKKDFLKYVKEVEAPEFRNQYDNLTLLEWLQINKGQAEIHMMALAEAMYDAMNESTPKVLNEGEWHIPFGDGINIPLEGWEFATENDLLEDTIKIATARCARVSYTVVGEEGKEPNYANDIKLHDVLSTSGHWSPFEHCARVMNNDEYELFTKTYPPEINIEGSEYIVDYLHRDIYLTAQQGWCNNFRGFIQYRFLLNK